MAEEEEQKEGRASGPLTAVQVINSLKWPVAVVLVAFFAYLAFSRASRAVEEGARAPATAIENAGELATTIAERFKTGRITTTFTAALPRLIPDGGTRLEIASMEATETFRRTDERRALFDLVPLGTNETEIKVLTTYRYHVRLDDQWRIESRDQACVVHAPALLPTLPPAIHTDRMEKRSSSGWLRFDVDEQMEELERSITPTVSERAAAPETIALVRDEARRQVAEFIRNWLTIEDHWRDDRFRTVTVIFADEEPLESRRPTIELSVTEEGDGQASGDQQ